MTDETTTTAELPKAKKKMSKRRKTVLIVGIVLASAGIITAIIVWAVFGGAKEPAPVASEPATPEPTVTVTAAPPTVDECVSDQLTLSLSDRESAENESTLRVIFTNSGASPCSIEGYPRVSFALSPGTEQIGQEALPDPTSLIKDLIIAPDESAHAILIITDVDRVTPCEPQDVDGFSLYPPVASSAMFVTASELQSCGDAGGPQLSIGALQAGD